MELTAAQLEKIIDESVYSLAKVYKPGEEKPVDMTCGFLAGRILKRFEDLEKA